ncbi:MAG: hypothetical protein PHZ17_04915 [Sulfurovum sp.]|nr:hypothetical protein [Sulfurovum sp.]
MGALTDKPKNIRMNTYIAMDAVSHTASFDEKLRDLRAELTKIVKNKNKLRADEKELYEFVMSNKQYVSFVKENIRTILTKGDEKKGFKHILIRHYGTGADSEISVWDIIRIGKTIIDGSYLTSAEIGRYKDRIGKSRQAKRRLSKTPDGDFIYIVGIGREINGDNIVITYFKNKLGSRATDVKPKSADVTQDTNGNGDRHVPNTNIIPKNTNQVNMDSTTQLTDKYEAILKKQAWRKRLMEWHKDSHPLTKNADGTPKVFYHGTDKSFDTFSYEKVGTNGTYTSGGSDTFFLSSNPDAASTYGGMRFAAKFDDKTAEKVKDMEAKRPLSIKAFGEYIQWEKDYLKLLSKANRADDYALNGANVIPAYVNIKNPMVIKGNGKLFRTLDNKAINKSLKKQGIYEQEWGNSDPKYPYMFTVDEAAKLAKKKGNDGLIVKNVIDSAQIPSQTDKTFIGETIVVFDPTQIKSIHNKGTFDENSNVITDSVTFDMAPHRHHIAEKMIGIPQEIEKFGRNFTKFKGKPKEAIGHLIKVKNGQVRGAIHKEGVGDIDFIWGKVTDAKRHKGYGFAHIIDKHGVEEAMKLPKMIEKLKIKIKTNNGLILEDEEYRVSIRLDWIGKSKIWVLTAFDKREADDNKAVSDAVEPTHLMPTHTCHKTGATSLTQIIPKNTNQVNMDSTTQLTDKYQAILKAKVSKNKKIDYELRERGEGTYGIYIDGKRVGNIAGSTTDTNVWNMIAFIINPEYRGTGLAQRVIQDIANSHNGLQSNGNFRSEMASKMYEKIPNIKKKAVEHKLSDGNVHIIEHIFVPKQVLTDSVTFDMSPVKSKSQKEKRGIWNVTFNDKEKSHIRNEDNQIIAEYQKGNEWFGASHIVFRHMQEKSSGKINNEEILLIIDVIRNGAMKVKIDKKNRVNREYTLFINNVRYRVFMEDDKNKKIISFYSNRRASVHNDSSNSSVNTTIPSNEKNVNMDSIQGNSMNILQQIKAERSAIAKSKLMKQWRSSGAIQRAKALKEYKYSINAVNDDVIDAIETIKAVLENQNATSPLQNTQRVL